LELVVAGVSGYKNLRANLRNPEDGTLVATQDFNTLRKYLAGTYDLEIPSTPVIQLRALQLKPGASERIQIPQPGMVNIVCNTGGYGAIFVVNGASLTKCYDLSPNLILETVVLQPGNYRVLYRSANSTRMVFSLVKDFSIKSGEITTVRF
jgi:Ca-activated chloride channel family protein